MNYRELQIKLKEYKQQELTKVPLNASREVLEAELNRIESQVAKTSAEVPETTTTEEVKQVASNSEDNLKGNYRIDKSEIDREGELWLERLDNDGEPIEDYISASPEQLEQLKANGQIWEYSSNIGRWIPPQPKSKKSPTPEEQEYLDELADAEKTVNKIDDFLYAVKCGELLEEQLGAIATAIVFSGEKQIPLSEGLAKIKKFHLFTPVQLMRWGFDEVIPRYGMLLDFRKAIARSKTQKLAG